MSDSSWSHIPNTTPTISIIMPVYNTGGLLVDSVRSVVDQRLFKTEQPGYWELLIVDDGSTDPLTRTALNEAAALSPAVRILQNQRGKGAAGARNTALHAARGDWIAFLDSDDLWYADFLLQQRDAFENFPDSVWRAAHFYVGDDEARPNMVPLSKRSPCLYGVVKDDYEQQRISVLRRPVDVLLRCGCIQVMTVQVRREVLVAIGGFNEALACAEDYDLWLRLATAHDLYLSTLDAGIYRVRAGSLTKSGRPMFYFEDRMLTSAKRNEAFAEFGSNIDQRLENVYSTYCYHFREKGKFKEATSVALKLIRLSPLKPTGWRHLGAIALRR